jgi:tRNA nucleotidyltransferase (CCA-adding enzyme)
MTSNQTNTQTQLANVPLPDEFEGLPVFVVGGAVRDWVRGVEPNDIDLMVAEVTPDEMRQRGFREIDSPNNDTFAVFQDSLGREVAIAREEVSTGEGHTDFYVNPVPAHVEATGALHRDLKRRDFTFNAMAFDLRLSVIHDPYGGLEALNEGVVRHVSEAFKDDPLRVLRGARFAARLDFDVAEETLVVMKNVATRLSELPPERIRMELVKAMKQAENPRKFFDILVSVDALRAAFPSLEAMRDIPAGPQKFHEEGSAFEHTMLVVQEMAALRPGDETALLMALTHDFGKLATPKNELPSHYGHGKAGVPLVKDFAERLRFNNQQKRAMVEASREHMRLKNVQDMKEKTLFDTFRNVRNPNRLVALMQADARGRRPSGEFDSQMLVDAFDRAKQACKNVTGQDLIGAGKHPDEIGGEKFGKLLRDARISEMKRLKLVLHS